MCKECIRSDPICQQQIIKLSAACLMQKSSHDPSLQPEMNHFLRASLDTLICLPCAAKTMHIACQSMRRCQSHDVRPISATCRVNPWSHVELVCCDRITLECSLPLQKTISSTLYSIAQILPKKVSAEAVQSPHVTASRGAELVYT